MEAAGLGDMVGVESVRNKAKLGGWMGGWMGDGVLQSPHMEAFSFR